MSVPKRLIIEYEDGTNQEIEFSELSRHDRQELSTLAFSRPPSVIPQPASSYLLLRWRDGWQEVIEMKESSVELLRYYVLDRVEEIGRMALEVKGDYPVLLTIKRKPKQLDSLVITGRCHQAFYGFEPGARREEGGKIEHVEYERADRNFQPEGDAKASVPFAEMVNSLKTELDNRSLTAERLLAMAPAPRAEEYKELARTLGLRAAAEQGDVYGFLQLVLEKLAAGGR